MAILPPNEFIPSVATVERPTEAPAAAFPSPQARDAAAACSDISDIGEIFAGARKLGYVPGDLDPLEYTSADELLYDVLKAMDNPLERDLPHIPDEDAFISEVEERPLFLRQAV